MTRVGQAKSRNIIRATARDYGWMLHELDDREDAFTQGESRIRVRFNTRGAVINALWSHPKRTTRTLSGREEVLYFLESVARAGGAR